MATVQSFRLLFFPTQRVDETAQAHANAIRVLNREIEALRDAAALVEQDGLKDLEKVAQTLRWLVVLTVCNCRGSRWRRAN